jgi:hypothetical protein
MSTSTATAKNFEDLLKMIGCEEDTIKAVNAAGVKKIEDLFSFDDDDVTTLCKLIRKENKPFPFVADKNLKIVVSEAQIRRQTNRTASQMYKANAGDIVIWKARQLEKLSFKDPKENAPEAQAIAKNWAKGFEQLVHWIGLHVDKPTGMPLAFAIRMAQLDSSPNTPLNYTSLFEEYAKRGRLQDFNGKELNGRPQSRSRVGISSTGSSMITLPISTFVPSRSRKMDQRPFIVYANIILESTT